MNKERQFPLKPVGINEYGFFVRNSANRFEGGERATDNSYDSLITGTHNPVICWIIGVEKNALRTFIESYKSVYQYVQCVCVPENSEDTIESINELLESDLTPKSEVEQVVDENKKLRNELEEMKRLLADAGIGKKKQSKTE